MDSEKSSPTILLFPFLGHGHISPFIELAKNLLNHNFSVYFCSTPVNLKKFATKLADYSIKQVEFHLPSSDELPPHYHTTSGLPPHLMFPLIDALESSSLTFSNILKSVQPDLVIYDIHQTWLPNVTASHHIPSVFFQTTSTTNCSHFLHSVKFPDMEYPFPEIFKTEYELSSDRRVKSPAKDADKERKKFISGIEASNEMILMRSSRAFEEKYIDFQTTLLNKKMVSVGSLVTKPVNDPNDDSEIIQWLNGKEEASVVYVSFGSELYLTKEEIEEVSLGLEISNVNFILVVRSPDQEPKLDEVMPDGFLDRIKGRGFVENVWAPQAKILTHRSTGAFVSHCGWGSVVESISFGVPIIAMPMQYDQFVNARLVGDLGVGLEVARQENGQRKREEIARIIEQVLLKDEGESIRRKSKDMGKKVRVKSEEELHMAAQELRDICEKKKKNCP